MDFDFSQEQYMFQKSMNVFLTRNYGLANVRASLQDEGPVLALWAKFAGMGVFSILVPEEYGGLGLSFVDLSLVFEEYGRALVPSPVVETLVATDVLVRHASNEQRDRILPAVAQGKLRIVPAIAETDIGFDPEDIATTATPSGDDWLLSGRKLLVPHAATADYVLVAARFGEGGPLGLVIVEPGRDHVSLREHSTFDPSGRFFEMTFDGMPVSRESVLGNDPSPLPLQRLLDASSMAAATLMTGIASKVLDTTLDYAAQRTQFDRPIGSFQAIKHRCADMAVAIDASRSAAYYAAWAVAHASDDCAKAVSIAKAFCGDASRFVCNQGIQIHGGIGFTWELGLHFYLCRAKVLEYSYGDAAWHRERVLASALAELTRSGMHGCAQ